MSSWVIGRAKGPRQTQLRLLRRQHLRQGVIVPVKIGHKDSKQLKHAIAACLSLLLLGASSLASACELSCSLSVSHPVSTPAFKLSSHATGSAAAPAADSAAPTMNMSHAHCGHARMARPSGGVTQFFHFEDASTCANAPCAQTQILSPPINGKDAVRIESRHFALFAVVAPVRTLIRPIATIKLEHAPPKLVLLDPLSVALRI